MLTPPDPVSQIGLALPTIILYEISIWTARLIEKRREEEDAPRRATTPPRRRQASRRRRHVVSAEFARTILRRFAMRSTPYRPPYRSATLPAGERDRRCRLAT